MKKVLTAFKFATVISLLINGIGVILGSLLTNLDSALTDYKEVWPMTLLIIFIPCFFTKFFTCQKDISSLKVLITSFIKAGAVSFSLVYITAYLTLRVYRHIEVPFLQTPSLFNGIIAVFITLFFLLLLYLTKKDGGQKRNKLPFIYGMPSLIWGIVTGIYLVLFISLGVGEVSFSFVTAIVLFGVFSTVITSFVLFKTYKEKSHFSTKTIINYLLNIFIYPYLIFLITNYNDSVLSVKWFFLSAVMIGPYFLFLTMLLHFYNLFQLNKVEKKELQQNSITASLKYQQLKSQLSPHFLFNNLSVLTGLIEEEPGKAVHFLENLSSIYRYFLTQEKEDLVRLEEELDFADKYMDLLQIRFEGSIFYNNLIVSVDPKNRYILPLSLQQVFENVVKHNEISKEKPMSINMYIEDDYLVVSNSLIPKEQLDLSEKVGLINIKHRYSFFTDKEIIVGPEDNNYVIKLPLLKIEV